MTTNNKSSQNVLSKLEMTLFDKINQHALASPEKLCSHLVNFQNNQPVAEGISYAELINRTLKLANILKLQGKAGDRVIISIENPIRFLITFLAVLAAKRIAVPVPTVNNFKSQGIIIKRVLNICQDCQPSLFIVENRHVWEAADFPDSQLISVDSLALETPTNAPLREILPKVAFEEIAYLQYTSGSTGNPKGCMISHGNIVANIHSIGVIANTNEHEVAVSWLPLYHDMGLVGGLLIPLYWNMKHYLLTPQQFVAKPINWLRVISEYRGSTIIGPTFGYHLVSHYVQERQLAGIDLSSIRLAYIGAEPIPVKTANQFITRFKPYGFNPKSFYPSYGMAECTVAAALPPIDRDMVVDTVERAGLVSKNKAIRRNCQSLDTVSFISVGCALPDHEITIININTGKECAERELGEITIKGPSVFKGYFNKENVDGFLRTGDLGYIANGELYVVDRIKDLIIIAGQNYYPSDIESSLMELSELASTKVLCFAAESELGTESLQVFIEVKNNFAIPAEQVSLLVKQHIHRQFGISGVHVSLVPRGSLERTSSGKVMRSLYKDRKLSSVINQQNHSLETCE